MKSKPKPRKRDVANVANIVSVDDLHGMTERAMAGTLPDMPPYFGATPQAAPAPIIYCIATGGASATVNYAPIIGNTVHGNIMANQNGDNITTQTGGMSPTSETVERLLATIRSQAETIARLVDIIDKQTNNIVCRRPRPPEHPVLMGDELKKRKLKINKL
jgi:hypothetical protein